MRRMLADKESCDVLLAAGTDASEVAAHKCVLASRSSYFRALFSSEFRERSEGRVLLEDISFEQLTYLLHFIYADDWLVEDPEFAFEMIPIADRFSVLDLKRLCERTLICSMSVANVARIFSMADRYSCTRLRSRALFFMTDTANFHSVMKTSTFAELDKALILEILHSHKAAPVPAPPPSEPLPGNSATLSKAGQSKMRDHRHGRGGGNAGAGTARPAPGSAAAANALRGGASSSSCAPNVPPPPPHPANQADSETAPLPGRSRDAVAACAGGSSSSSTMFSPHGGRLPASGRGNPPSGGGAPPSPECRRAQEAPVVSPPRPAQSGEGLANESFFELGPD